VAERVATLTRLLEPSKRPRIVLTTVNALVQRVPPAELFRGTSVHLKKGGRVAPEKLAGFLEASGYGRAATVMEPGEYAVRGGIVDLYPAGEPEPVRLDLFGDEIESLRRFSPETQRSGVEIKELWLRPVGEVFLDEASIARFRSGYRDLFGPAAGDDPLYVSISAGRRHPGMEHWAGLFHDQMETLLDYLPGASVSLDYQAEDALEARLEMIEDHYQARKGPGRDGEVPYRPVPPGKLYLDRARLGRHALRRHAAALRPIPAGGGARASMPAAARGGCIPKSGPRARMSSPHTGNRRRPRPTRGSSPCWRPGPRARASGWPICCGRTRSPRRRWRIGPPPAACRPAWWRWRCMASSAASSAPPPGRCAMPSR
jgi:transcription-repair coupling factor (superfamily II helicase)